ncbi:carbohydrate kinase family protein [Tranquillimonas alkanivorans]|uniref:Fructokinase n=1 Tax=Tranquillimonas alkanivorans TaxID=441119 RepID=A0A1I5NDE2_9RHOB|nr:carbohydrate kinase [Tranquillimonas alkanivorans]SFP19828.1 fructokinase [Tranquillimonas alkanivorans]
MILCCGEALIDMLPRTTTAGESAFAPYPGGAVFNTAVALGRLGAPTGFFSGLSTDLFGAMLTDALGKSGVDASPAALSDRPTTLAFVQLVEGQATYAFYDENTAGRMLSEDDLPALGPDVDALFFGGISLVAEPCGSSLEALMTREADVRVTMIDPNIRPGFVRDEPTYRARIERMIALADIVKLSDDDLHWLEGRGDTAALARALLQKGPKLVCITEGAKGATGYTAEHTVAVPARPVTVVDTVGAGDTFNAGVLAGLSDAGALSKKAIATLSPETIEAALALGVRAASITVARAGASPPRREEL